MKSNTGMRLMLLVGFVVLLVAACQATVDLAHVSPTRFESPLSTVVDPVGAICSYRATLRSEMRYAQPIRTTPAEILEINYTWKRTDGQYGYDAHIVTTLVDPQSGAPKVMDESYAAGDFVFTQSWNGWSVAERTPDIDLLRAALVSGHGALPDIDSVAQMNTLPIAALVAQSIVIGDEEISGIPATHYRLTDFPTIDAIVRAKLGSAPATPLEVKSAQFDIWLTMSDRLPIQYTFQAEGKAEAIAGPKILLSFTLQDRYRITEVNSNLAVDVPADILGAVAPQLHRLKSR